MDRAKRDGLIALGILSAYTYTIAGVFMWLGLQYQLEYAMRLGVAVAISQTLLIMAFTIFPALFDLWERWRAAR